MNKYVAFPLIIYVMLCIIAILLPASEGYNAIGWKLFVGQIYALPTLIIVSLGSYLFYTKSKNNS